MRPYARHLPENGRFEDKIERNKVDVAQRFRLTPRESDVFMLLVDGKSRQSIADTLGLTVWTVKDYAKAIYEKTGTHGAKKLMALVAENR